MHEKDAEGAVRLRRETVYCRKYLTKDTVLSASARSCQCKAVKLARQVMSSALSHAPQTLSGDLIPSSLRTITIGV